MDSNPGTQEARILRASKPKAGRHSDYGITRRRPTEPMEVVTPQSLKAVAAADRMDLDSGRKWLRWRTRSKDVEHGH